MNTVTEELNTFIDGVGSMIEDVENHFVNRQNDFRSMCFYNIYNRGILTREIVTLLERSVRPFQEEDNQAQENERVVIVTRGLFTDTMSSIEKAAKDCIPAYWMNDIKEEAMKDNSYLYLRYIIYASAKKGLVSEKELKEWDLVFLMRNLVMHNNSVSDRSMIFEMGDLKISMRPDRMMKGPANTFVILSEKAVELFYNWLKAVNEAYRR
ncbi:hypothetical protein PED39_07285 [Methanomassiliicoccales archaeon LGM-RCC1]|nr:hypothetical protein PED39_07285 [Methanomassiliicoccales archaeon LGM-RCC1]